MRMAGREDWRRRQVQVQVRPARSDELRLLAEIGLAAWESAMAGWGEDVAALRDNAVSAYGTFVRDFWPTIRVAEVPAAIGGSRVVGWGAREKADNHISDLWVHPRHQGQGYGHALLGALIAEIRADGHDTATLDTHARNSGAIALYERNGFAISAYSVRYSASLQRDVETVDMRKELL